MKFNKFMSVSLTYLVFGLWISDANAGGLAPAPVPLCDKTPYQSGDGVSTPYEICSAQQLIQLSGDSLNWDKSFILTRNINMAGISHTPIGGNDPSFFRGTFNGQGYTISNLSVTKTSGDIGLFGAVQTAHIFNLRLRTPTLTQTGTASNQYARMGSLAGYASGDSIIEDIRVTGATLSSASTNSISAVGGLMGQYHDGALSGSGAVRRSSISSDIAGTLSTVRITRGTAGGLIGSVQGVGSDVSDCFAKADSSSSAKGNVGGLIGKLEEGKVNRSYSAGSVGHNSDVSWAGGLAALVLNPLGGQVRITDSFSVVDPVVGSGFSVGRLVGGAVNGSILNSWTHSGSQCISYYPNAIDQACNTSESNSHDDVTAFHSPASEPLNTWDFTQVWKENAGALPTLR